MMLSSCTPILNPSGMVTPQFPFNGGLGVGQQFGAERLVLARLSDNFLAHFLYGFHCFEFSR